MTASAMAVLRQRRQMGAGSMGNFKRVFVGVDDKRGLAAWVRITAKGAWGVEHAANRSGARCVKVLASRPVVGDSEGSGFAPGLTRKQHRVEFRGAPTTVSP